MEGCNATITVNGQVLQCAFGWPEHVDWDDSVMHEQWIDDKLTVFVRWVDDAPTATAHEALEGSFRERDRLIVEAKRYAARADRYRKALQAIADRPDGCGTVAADMKRRAREALEGVPVTDNPA